MARTASQPVGPLVARCGDERRGAGFRDEHAVEKHIAASNAKATIIAPVYFMENAVSFGTEQLAKGVYATPLTPERKLAQIAVADIAAVAVSVLENREKHAGKRWDIGGDDVSGNDVCAILTKVTGKKPFNYFQVPMEMIRQRMGEDGVRMYEWFEKVGYTLDHAALQKAFPDVRWTTFEAWAKTQD